METLTREEIEMCEIAVGIVMDERTMTDDNKAKWDALWDKLERMQRETCLTPLALDAAMPPSAEPLSGLESVPAVEFDTQPRK